MMKAYKFQESRKISSKGLVPLKHFRKGKQPGVFRPSSRQSFRTISHQTQKIPIIDRNRRKSSQCSYLKDSKIFFGLSQPDSRIVGKNKKRVVTCYRQMHPPSNFFNSYKTIYSSKPVPRVDNPKKQTISQTSTHHETIKPMPKWSHTAKKHKVAW